MTVERVHEIIAERDALKAECARLQRAIGVIAQTACDADEIPAFELLHEIADIAMKHAWPQAALAADEKEG